MARKDIRVDAYIAKAPEFARPILTHLREVVHAGCPDVEETIKWSVPHFDYQGSLCGMASIKDLPPKRALIGYVKKAAAHNTAGEKGPPREKKVKQSLPTPAYLAAALRKNKKAQANFDAFSPSHRREYVEWLTDANAEATRMRRLEAAIEWIAEGKSRNWKYVK